MVIYTKDAMMNYLIYEKIRLKRGLQIVPAVTRMGLSVDDGKRRSRDGTNPRQGHEPNE